MQPAVVVCDLDDTLIRTDLLFESVLKLLRTKPLTAFRIPLWLLRGIAYTKSAIASHVQLEPALLPYRDEVLNLVKMRRHAGARTVLLSASADELVQAVASYCQCFDSAAGSSAAVNLKGTNKLAWIERNFPGEFEYIGDSKADLPVWRQSARAVLVNASRRTRASVHSFHKNVGEISDRSGLLTIIKKQLRVRQWVKNILVAVPLLAAHRADNVGLLWNVLLGMASFSLIASAVYVMNDMLDMENDRKHPTKKDRPFASGRLPLKYGFALAPALALTSFTIGGLISWGFTGMIGLYLVSNLIYSLKVKETVMMDVVLLASFYTMRLLAGAEATGIKISQWLMIFSTFFFLGLALVKRYTELLRIVGRNQSALHGRGYNSADKIPVLIMGITCSMLSILILTLYFGSADIQLLYSHPSRLWLMAPLLLFWSGRMWLLTHRGEVDDDPVVFALKDKVSLAVAVYFVFIISWAI